MKVGVHTVDQSCDSKVHPVKINQNHFVSFVSHLPLCESPELNESLNDLVNIDERESLLRLSIGY